MKLYFLSLNLICALTLAEVEHQDPLDKNTPTQGLSCQQGFIGMVIPALENAHEFCEPLAKIPECYNFCSATEMKIIRPRRGSTDMRPVEFDKTMLKSILDKQLAKDKDNARHVAQGVSACARKFDYLLAAHCTRQKPFWRCVDNVFACNTK